MSEKRWYEKVFSWIIGLLSAVGVCSLLCRRNSEPDLDRIESIGNELEESRQSVANCSDRVDAIEASVGRAEEGIDEARQSIESSLELIDRIKQSNKEG